MFYKLKEMSDDTSKHEYMFTVHCSYLEIYNEKVMDLLDPTSSVLQIKEDQKRGFYVEGLTWNEVKSTKEIWQFIKQGI